MFTPINPEARIFAIVIGALVFLYVINLVRTRRLREDFALFWLVTGTLIVGVALLVDWVDALSLSLGIEYPPSLLFLLAFLCLFFICIQFSINISKLTDQNKILVQEIALLERRTEELENEKRPFSNQ